MSCWSTAKQIYLCAFREDAWRRFGSLTTHKAHSEDSDQTSWADVQAHKSF